MEISANNSYISQCAIAVVWTTHNLDIFIPAQTIAEILILIPKKNENSISILMTNKDNLQYLILSEVWESR